MEVIQKRNLSKKDKEAIVKLLAESFPGDFKQLIARFSSEMERKKNAHYLIAVDSDEIVGVLVLYDKVMNFLDIPLKLLGMSYMAIAKGYQNSDVADTFKATVLEISNEYDLALGFARKKMDGYWSPYQFVGVTNFSEFLINIYDIKVFDPLKSVSIETAVVSDISYVLDCATWDKHLLVGNIERTPEDIEFLIKNPKEKGKVNIIRYGKKKIGYMINSLDNVVEIKVQQKFREQTSFAIKEYFRNLKIEDIYFSQQLIDPFLVYLRRFSHQQKKRYVFDGGHIVRISNLKQFFKKITPALQKRLLSKNIQSFSYSNDLLSIKMADGHLDISIKDNASPQLLTMLAFGIVPDSDIVPQTLFGGLNAKFSILDEF